MADTLSSAPTDTTTTGTTPSNSSPSTAVSHPLNNTWVLHYNGPNEARHGEWNVVVKRVLATSTVELFWSLYNSIKQPSTLGVGSNYHFFLDGVKPEWEDPAVRSFYIHYCMFTLHTDLHCSNIILHCMILYYTAYRMKKVVSGN